jgi:Concanavalin A-like lectin/glucanases superfamily
LAVRFDGVEPYTATAGLPAGTVYTVTCWAMISVDRNTYSEIVSLGNSTSPSTYCSISTNADGTSVGIFDLANYSGAGVGETSMTVGAWYRLAMVVNGASATFYIANGPTGSLTATSVTDLTPPTPGAMSLGNYVGGGSFFLDGRLAAVKMWSAELAAAEVEAELAQYQPRRTANLLRWHPFLTVETTDYSGNGNTLSGGSGATTEDGPPIPWGPSAPRLILPAAAAGNQGALVAAAPSPTASLTGTAAVSGQTSVTAPPSTGSATATLTAVGSLSVAAPLPVASLTDVSAATGPVAVTAPAAASVFTGTVTAAGQVAAAAPLPTASIATPPPLPDRLELGPKLPIPAAARSVRRNSARWRIMVVDTRTGRLLGELPYTGLTWSDTLDFTRTSSLSVTVPLETVDGVARIRSIARGQWRYTLLATYSGRPIVAGPLITHKVAEDVASVELGCGSPASLFAARLVTRVNFLLNPSFEDGVSGWTAIGPVGSTVSQVTATVPPTDPTPPDGDSWLRVTSGGSSGTIAVASPRVPITPGLPYVVSAFVKNSASGQAVDGFVLWYSSLSGDPWDWDSFEYEPWGNVYGAWGRKSITVIAPEGAVALGLQIQAPAAASGHYLDLDAVLVEHTLTVNAFDVTQGEVKTPPRSLPEIARLLALLTTLKTGANPGAELPITLPAVNPDGEHVRTYQMHELGTIAERLGQLTQVENGPDVHLRPVLSADGHYMAWELRIGEPRLGRAAGWTWTYGANCTTISVDSDASAMTMRAYVPGQSGTDTTPIGAAEDLSLLDAGWPLLERADGARSTTETTVNLDAQAADYLRAHDRPVEQWQVSVRADSQPALGIWALGDEAILRLRGHRWIEDGDYPRRILSVSGDAGDQITLGVTSGEGRV